MGKLQNVILLDDTQKDLILTNLDARGRLSCLKAFKVSRLIGLKPLQMSDACKSINIKITNCELGVFGKLEFKEFEKDIYTSIMQNHNEEKKLSCKTLWNEARATTLRKVGSTVKKSDIEVLHCQLGCFREKLSHENKS
ncbi:MAG: ModE family transcriptional regulator [Campylobacterales bacterium]|nr:ModE family transcriptional regulator [Campylobacterales bacterium]